MKGVIKLSNNFSFPFWPIGPVVAALALVLSLTACGSQANLDVSKTITASPSDKQPVGQISGHIFIFGCDDKFVQEPTMVGLNCSDGEQFIGNIKWSSWDNKKAQGTGEYHGIVCKPECKPFSSKSAVSISLEDVVREQSGKYVFNLVRVISKALTPNDEILHSLNQVLRPREITVWSDPQVVTATPDLLVMSASQNTCASDADGPYCYVDIEIRNQSNGPISISGQIRLQTQDGKTFIVDTSQYSNAIISVTLNPNAAYRDSVTIHAAQNTDFNKVEIFDDTTSANGGIILQSSLNWSIQ